MGAARDELDVPRTLLLHRMVAATVDPLAAVAPKGFDLAAYLATNRHAFQLGPDIRLRTLVNADAVISIQEGHLAQDQKLTLTADGRYLVEATVAHTYALRVWILGFAEGMEVVEPVELRAEIARKLTEAAKRYRGAATKGPVQRSRKR